MFDSLKSCIQFNLNVQLCNERKIQRMSIYFFIHIHIKSQFKIYLKKCIRNAFAEDLKTATYMKMEQMIPFFVSQSFTINIRFIYVCIFLRANECTSLEIVLCKIYTYT